MAGNGKGVFPVKCLSDFILIKLGNSKDATLT